MSHLQRKALLVFAQAISVDLHRRGWPKKLQVLLETQFATSGCIDGVDVHFFGSNGVTHSTCLTSRVHPQRGDSFAERLENAIETLALLGYDEIVIVGRDCPDLEISDITRAFSLLKAHHLVLGPDHRGGCYLIAFRAGDRSRLKQVRWQQNSDCCELQERFDREATFLLPVKQDLDSIEDVRLLANSESRWKPVAEELLLALQSEFSPFHPLRVYASAQRMKIQWQLPPPKDFPSTEHLIAV